MAISEKTLLEISREFKKQLKKTCASSADLRQEAHLALLLSEEHADIKKHLSKFIQNSTNFDQPSGLLRKTVITPTNLESHTLLLKALIDRCPYKERTVLLLMYGISDGKCRDYIELAEIFGLSVNQIKKLEKRAIQTIRKSSGFSFIKSELFSTKS